MCVSVIDFISTTTNTGPPPETILNRHMPGPLGTTISHYLSSHIKLLHLLLLLLLLHHFSQQRLQSNWFEQFIRLHSLFSIRDDLLCDAELTPEFVLFHHVIRYYR